MRKKKAGIDDKDFPFTTNLVIVCQTYATFFGVCGIVAKGGNAMQDHSSCRPMREISNTFASLSDTSLLDHMAHCNDSQACSGFLNFPPNSTPPMQAAG